MTDQLKLELEAILNLKPHDAKTTHEYIHAICEYSKKLTDDQIEQLESTLCVDLEKIKALNLTLEDFLLHQGRLHARSTLMHINFPLIHILENENVILDGLPLKPEYMTISKSIWDRMEERRRIAKNKQQNI